MKKHHSFACIMFFAMLVFGCAEREVGTQNTKLNKEEVYNLMLLRTPFYVSAATRESSSGTEDLMLDTLSRIYQNNVFFVFYEDYVNFYAGTPTQNDTIPATARAFTLNSRISLPTNITHKWDDEKGTVSLKFSGVSSYFPMLRDNQSAYLDTENFNLTESYNPASGGVPPSMKFISKENDPKLGEVTYTFTLKPMWMYYKDPSQQVFANYVVY
ncbi:hypothetical protein [Dyadobacter linearis]|nr:hypothetical protein [Dyadobacter sp. CECT 9623]